MSRAFLPVEAIKKTRDQIPLSEAEIKALVRDYTLGEIPDYQISAWLMAVRLRGLTTQETLWLTQAMLKSGTQLNLSTIPQKKVDKHSTGGIGDKTSLILGPIVAACGVTVPMMSGRGLGHTGGTLDKLESIPGFNTQQDLVSFTKILSQFGICFIGQTKDICPADKKMYALRDVTGTIESLELISASIMSKKLAEDLDGLVLDVKFGSGAFMKTIDAAKNLAVSLQKIGKGAGKKVTALLTNMNQPLGSFIGNALETFECVEILQGRKLINKNGIDLYADTRDLSLELAAHMLLLGGKALELSTAKTMAEEALTSGRALRVFEDVCRAQGGTLEQLPRAPHSRAVPAPHSGYVASFDGEKIGMLGIKLGAGRSSVTDSIDPTAGFQIHFKIGEKIAAQDTLWTIYASSEAVIDQITQDLLSAVTISVTKPEPLQLIDEVLY